MVGSLVYVLNGPNLDRLGKRQPEIYGTDSLDHIRKMCEEKAEEYDSGIRFLQSPHEGDLVRWIAEADDTAQGIVINAAAYTHTSFAILDALLGASIPSVEVHISNIYKRETFRQHSAIACGTSGMITGFGSIGYVYALVAVFDIISVKKR
jgi:3-dehydroquinate dehydratase-2